MWRMRVVHSTGYEYTSPVAASYNEVRLTPRSDSRQNVIVNRVETLPASRSYRYTDYWGSAVTAFDLHAAHTRLEVTSSSIVETDPAEPPTAKASWDELAAVQDRYGEVIAGTAYAPTSRRVAAVGRRIAKYNDPADAVIAAGQWVRSELAYVAGSTSVHSSGLDALREGRGVCQDFTHLCLILLRGMGIPCRYVSGYLHPIGGRGSGTPWSGRVTPGCRPGPAAGGTTTPPTTARSASSTSAWRWAATTPTCPHSRASTSGKAPPSSPSVWISPGWPESAIPAVPSPISR